MEDAREQQQQLAAYYEAFNLETNNGRVFVDDLSQVDVEIHQLTTTEENARLAYQGVVSRLVRAYPFFMRTHPIATTKEEVLQQRVVAPSLKHKDVSNRSATNEARAGRLYPRNIHPWTRFQDAVAGYHLDNSTQFDEAMNGIFLFSLNRATDVCCNEANEQGSIISNLNQTLKKAGIIHEVRGISRIDFCIMKDESTTSIICECKSTHNLLLPMTAVDCEAAYNAAYVLGERNIRRSRAWANVAHPIGQLLSYMVDAKHRFGALTSGTKTYFIKIQSETDGGAKVYISDAWCVGEENYLRAWAYMHTLHESTDPWIAPTDWIQSTTSINTPRRWQQRRPPSKQRSGRMKQGEVPSPNDVRDSGADGLRKSTKHCNLDNYFSIHRDVLEYVPFDDIVFLDVLGNGRNGDCFKVQWNGTECAMKQFDIGRDGDTYFEKEIQAYMMLQNAWGILVPRPMFLSESFSGGRLYLGLQLGRKSTSDEDLPKFENVLQQLETEYGIRHCDAECGRNMIVITDSDGVERVAAIDLEDWVEV